MRRILIITTRDKYEDIYKNMYQDIEKYKIACTNYAVNRDFANINIIHNKEEYLIKILPRKINQSIRGSLFNHIFVDNNINLSKEEYEILGMLSHCNNIDINYYNNNYVSIKIFLNIAHMQYNQTGLTTARQLIEKLLTLPNIDVPIMRYDDYGCYKNIDLDEMKYDTEIDYDYGCENNTDDNIKYNVLVLNN